MNVYYTDSLVMHVTLGDDFLGLCDKKISYIRCDQKLWWMLLPSAIQWKGRDLQYGKRRVRP